MNSKQKHCVSHFPRNETGPISSQLSIGCFVSINQYTLCELGGVRGVGTNLHVGRLRLQLGQVVGVVLQLLSQVGILHLQHLHLPQQLVVGRRCHAAGATTDLRRRQQTQGMNERNHE